VRSQMEGCGVPWNWDDFAGVRTHSIKVIVMVLQIVVIICADYCHYRFVLG